MTVVGHPHDFNTFLQYEEHLDWLIVAAGE